MTNCIEFESDAQALDHVIAGIPLHKRKELAMKALKRREYGALQVLINTEDIEPEFIEKLQKKLKR